MACVHATVFERHVEYPQCALFRHFILGLFGEIVVILCPLDLGAIVLLHRALDFHLRAIEDCRCAANFQTNRLLIGIVLNVARCCRRDMRSIIFRIACFRVARFRLHWLHARTHCIVSTNLVVLSHRLLAEHGSVLVAAAARFRTTWPFANCVLNLRLILEFNIIEHFMKKVLKSLPQKLTFPSCWTVENIAILPVAWRRLGTVCLLVNRSYIEWVEIIKKSVYLVYREREHVEEKLHNKINRKLFPNFKLCFFFSVVLCLNRSKKKVSSLLVHRRQFCYETEKRWLNSSNSSRTHNREREKLIYCVKLV